jgi:hypothetical protein
VHTTAATARQPAPTSTHPPFEAGPSPSASAELLDLSQVDLLSVFRRSSAGEIPIGGGRGTPIIFPGTAAAKWAAAVLGTVVWRGKVFRPGGGDLKNLVSILAIPAIPARVYREPSWLDGQDCIVLDYSETSRVAGWLRDEIREASPGVYLGLVYGVGRVFGGRRLLNMSFALTFPPPTSD